MANQILNHTPIYSIACKNDERPVVILLCCLLSLNERRGKVDGKRGWLYMFSLCAVYFRTQLVCIGSDINIGNLIAFCCSSTAANNSSESTPPLPPAA